MGKRVQLQPAHLPALRCKMGDRGYFVTAMRFDEVASRIKGISEIHSSKKLSQWIQRQLDNLHSSQIAKYLVDNDDRFFSSIVIGVYGGDPAWAELTVGDPRNELSEEDEDRVNRTVGVLTLSGKEKLFAVDGQHRVSGIKAALDMDQRLASEEVSVILVGHARTELGLTRTRQLFVTLNKRAKRVSPRDIVALDEDNGLAITTRRLIDENPLFGKEGFVSFSGSVTLGSSEPRAITSVLGLFQIVKALYPRDGKRWPKLKAIQDERPSEEVLKAMYTFYESYWNNLIEVVPEYKTALVVEKRTCDYYRTARKNHLLFRPLGQLAFARAVEFMIAKGKSMDESIRALHSANTMELTNKVWHQILWNPVGEVMMTNWTAAQTLLLIKAGETGMPELAKRRLKKLQETPTGQK